MSRSPFVYLLLYATLCNVKKINDKSTDYLLTRERAADCLKAALLTSVTFKLVSRKYSFLFLYKTMISVSNMILK